MASGEDTSTQRQRRARTDDRDEAADPISYQNADGDTLIVTGDDDSMYTGPLGRASDDGVTGLVAQANGETQRFALDELGHLWVREVSPTPATAPSRYTSAAAEQGKAVKQSAGVIFRIAMLTTSGLGSDVILMVFDQTTAPANGQTPIWRALLNAPGGGAIGEVSDGFDPDKPLACLVGISIGVSSTLNTFTGAGSIGFFEILYE